MPSQHHPRHSPSRWTHTTQRLLLAACQDRQANTTLVPLVDHHSKAAFQCQLEGAKTTLWDAGCLWPGVLLLWPLQLAFWFWQRGRAGPAWEIDFAQRTVRSLRQKRDTLLQLTPEMGLLAHNRQIDITHPRQGPLLTLFTAAPSRDPQDRLAQETLAQLLTERLNLRLVGCRVQLI